MADEIVAKNVLSVVATTSSRVKNLIIKNGQLVFVQDLNRIAFDFNGQRKFYNQLTTLDTEVQRTTLDSPLSGYYFVIDTAVLWLYKSGWVKITKEPEEVIFVGTENEIPTLGQANKIYANTTSENEHISIWDEESEKYVVVADKTQEVTNEDIENLFK